MKAPIDTSFIYDLSQLNSLRQDAASSEHSDDALRAAAEQFEALFTQMLFKSMRQANEAFESGLIDDRTSKFYQQMSDEQLSSSLSREGSLGLADLIYQQAKGPQNSEPTTLPVLPVRGGALPTANVALPAALVEKNTNLFTPLSMADNRLTPNPNTLEDNDALPPREIPSKQPEFTSPDEFVSRLMPFAKKAARALGIDPAILIAQAALETGWGKKVIRNSNGSSHNLFNIKADPQWQGPKVAVQTLEFHQDIPVQETASFRAYPAFEDSFDDYVHFLNQNPRYETALTQSTTPEVFIRELHDAGYATDPKYSQKVMSVFSRVKGIMEN